MIFPAYVEWKSAGIGKFSRYGDIHFFFVLWVMHS